jgi:hypothetical protein
MMRFPQFVGPISPNMLSECPRVLMMISLQGMLAFSFKIQLLVACTEAYGGGRVIETCTSGVI